MPHSPDDEPLMVSSHFVRGRDALCVRSHFTALYTDYYLHLMQHGIRNAPQHDAMLKDALAAITLHMVSRPPDEISAWTVGFQEPLLNLFATANNRTGTVTGRVFTEDVKKQADSLFFAQTLRGNEPARQSVVPVHSTDFLSVAEEFYRQSQQIPARYFRLQDAEDIALVVAMPGCDAAWIAALTSDKVEQLDRHEELQHMVTRPVRFGCECTLPKIVRSLASLSKLVRDEMFASDEYLLVTCPRCGARFQATPEDIERSLDSPPPQS